MNHTIRGHNDTWSNIKVYAIVGYRCISLPVIKEAFEDDKISENFRYQRKQKYELLTFSTYLHPRSSIKMNPLFFFPFTACFTVKQTLGNLTELKPNTELVELAIKHAHVPNYFITVFFQSKQNLSNL